MLALLTLDTNNIYISQKCHLHLILSFPTSNQLDGLDEVLGTYLPTTDYFSTGRRFALQTPAP